MKLLILTHDAVETLDRRIVNESRVFTEHGWKVHIVLTSSAGNCKAHEVEKDIVVDPIPNSRLEQVYDPLFHDSRVAEIRNMLARRFPTDSRAYRMLRSCYWAVRTVRSWLGDKHTPETATCNVPTDEAEYKARPNPSALLGRWIKSQSPDYASLFKNARQAYLTMKKAKVLLGRKTADEKTKTLIQDSNGSTAGICLDPGEEHGPYPLPYTLSFLKKAKDLTADAIFVCDLPSLPPGLQLSLAWQVPLIYDSHEFYVEQDCFTPKQKRVLEHHERLGLQHCKLCFVVSDQISQGIQEKYNLPKRPEVLYNAPMFRYQEAHIDIAGIRRKLGLKDSQRYLLYHGGLAKGRNLERLATTFRSLNPPDTVLVMLGYGEYDRFENLCKRLGGNLIVHPAVPQDDLVHWVSGAEAVIIPYLTTEKAYEFALPNKLFDCIQLGTPIIANHKLVSLKQIVSDYPIAWLGPMESDDQMQQTLTDGMNWLKYKEGRAAAFRSAHARYGWEEQKEIMCRSLRQIGLPGF